MPMKEKVTEFEKCNGVGIDIDIIGRDGNPATLHDMIRYRYIGETPDNPEIVILNTPIGADVKKTRFWEMKSGYSMEEEPHSRYYPYPHVLALTQSIMGDYIDVPVALVLSYREKNPPISRRTTYTYRTILFHPTQPNSPRMLA